MKRAFRYSRWDGSQVGFDLDADALLSELTDDLLYHGDLNAALRRALQQGFRDREGRDVQGLREMLDKLRRQRRELLDRYDLGGVYDDISRQLEEVVEQEREGIDRRVDEARQSGDQRREELLDELAQQRRRELDELPPDLAGRVQELQQYDWMDDAARQRFEALMQELRSQLLDNMFNQLSEGMSQMSPEQMQHMKTCSPTSTGCSSSVSEERSPTSPGSWSATATSSPTTRSHSTSCSSRWRGRWPRCSRCSTR
jgi:Uncharacterized protein with a von Willebrand factor type A (vWA) domain